MTHTTLSHGNAEDLYIQMSKHLNCPHCGGSGHVDDVAQQEPIAFIDMREWPPIRWRDGMVRADVAPFDGQGLFFAPTQRKPLTIPDDVVKAAISFQKNDYQGPLAWARKVFDWVAAHGVKS